MFQIFLKTGRFEKSIPRAICYRLVRATDSEQKNGFSTFRKIGKIANIWNFSEMLLFRTLRGKIDPGESEFDVDRNFQAF